MELQNFDKMGMPKKYLGQHFLRCSWVAKTMTEAAEINERDTILEIGPGRGELTRGLAKHAQRVIAVEKDERLARELAGKLVREKVNNAKVVTADILTYLSRQRLKRYKAVGNIPYYLTSRLLRILLENKTKPQSITFTIQKEVAQRIVAKPPRMNMLAVSAQIFGKPEIVKTVPRGCFWPQPRVDSAIIKISDISDRLFAKNPVNTKDFFKILRLGFSKKRKFLSNNLKELAPKFDLEKIFKKARIPARARAEELSIEQWIKLAKVLRPKTPCE